VERKKTAGNKKYTGKRQIQQKAGIPKEQEKVTPGIKSPYASLLCCKGLVQHELKHN
jgi:hypothetical protein